MLIIGLTGGIGSGKSTVANIFAARDVPIIDADIIAREVTNPDQPAFAKIVKHFKDDILLENRTLDRNKLRQIIFEHSKERHWLENLLHPIIRAEMESKLQKVSAPYVILVIPLLVEVGPYPFLDRVLVVDTPEELQIGRIITRDKISAAVVKAMLKTQVSRKHRLSKADDVIINDGLKADLEQQVENLHQKYLKMAENNTTG